MYSSKRVPETLTIIVLCARGLKPKRDDRCKYSVIFGVGSKKFKTDVIEDFHGCPVFNSESEISVTDINGLLTFKVVEKHSDDPLGQVIIPISEISTFQKDVMKTFILQPNKKNHQAFGELNLKVWVSSWRNVQDEDARSTDSTKKSSLSLNFLKKFMPHEKQKNDPRVFDQPIANPTVSNLKKKKGFNSCTDLSTFQTYITPVTRDDLSLKSHDEHEEISMKPEVSGISPKEGPVEGGTKLVIRGNNLGERKEDVVGLFVCGSNVLGSLEFISPSKLLCTTKPWRACTGNVTVETQSGGKGVSFVQFTFLPSAVEDGGDVVMGGGKKVDKPSMLLEGGDDSGISMDGGSLKRNKALDAKMTSDDSPRNSMARNILNLAKDLSKKSEGRPAEITSVSPKEVLYNVRMKVVIKGSNLAISQMDILKLMICGMDFTDTIEFDSPSKLVCYVGPVSRPISGIVSLETSSAGTCTSQVEFKFLPDKKELDRVMSKDKISSLTSTPSPGSSPHVSYIMENSKKHHFGSISSTLSYDIGAPDSPAVIPATRLTLPLASKPPVVEIQPMVKLKKKDSDRVALLESRLKDCVQEIDELTCENKKLNEECSRLKQYMEIIVSRAINTCPQILAVDM